MIRKESVNLKPGQPSIDGMRFRFRLGGCRVLLLHFGLQSHDNEGRTAGGRGWRAALIPGGAPRGTRNTGPETLVHLTADMIFGSGKESLIRPE